MKKSQLKHLWISLFVLNFFCSDQVTITGLSTMQEQPSDVSEPVLMKTLPGSWDENWFSSPAVYDLDRDGLNEIIAARHSVVYVWNADGTLKWRAPVGENASSANNHGSSRVYCSPVVGDLDNDTKGEIAVCYSNKVAVYDHTGTLESGWPQPFPQSADEIRSLAAEDLDNDHLYEVVAVKTSDGPVTCVWSINGIINNGWPQVSNRTGRNDYGGYNQNVGAADLDGNGTKEIVATYDICHIGVMNADGSELVANTVFGNKYVSDVPMFHELSLAIQGWGADGKDRDEFTDSPPAMADVDNDGLPEIILFSDHERAGEYKNRGNSLWVLNPDMTRVPGFEKPFTTGIPLYTGYQDNIVQVAPVPCISYLENNRVNIIAPSYDGKLYCFDANGTVRWSVRFDCGDAFFTGCSETVAGDLDNDGVSEIVFCTYSTDKDKIGRAHV